MLYSRLVHRLFHVNKHGGIKLGLANAYQLQQALNFPDHSFSSIHIAGTNGKGSVATKIAGAFQAAGYRVGLYTSPHLSCFRERIRVDKEMISEKDVERLLPLLFDLVEQENIPATFFEIATFLAFLYFAQEKVDVAILETGLGGRLDATNVVIPILSVITSISLDHTEILGATIEDILKEKAGIIKPGVPVVIGPQTPIKLIEPFILQQNSPCIQVKGSFDYFEEENRAIAKQALACLKNAWPLSSASIEAGLEQNQPCRFEILDSCPPIILDVAHNPDGLSRLFQAVKQRFPAHKIRLLFGLSKTKDISSCLTLMTRYGSSFHLVEAPNGRGVDVPVLQRELYRLKIDADSIFIDGSIGLSVEKAVQKAKANNEVLVVCGSFFIMSQARQALNFKEPIDEIDLNEHVIAKP